MNDWISNLKPGDEVFVRSPYGDKYLRTVEKITPTGLIKVGGCLYTQEGRQRGETFAHRLAECTPGKKEEFMREVFTSKVLRGLRNVPNITYKQAIEINKVLNLNIEHPF